MTDDATSPSSGASSGRGAALFLAFILLAGAAVMNLLDLGKPAQGPTEAQIAAREATGGGQTLEDILARQRGERVDDSYRRAQTGRDAPSDEMLRSLGTLGAASDADVFRALRFGAADVTVSTNRDADRVLVQDGGMWWLKLREGPLARWALYAMGGMLLAVTLFYFTRGPIRIGGGRSGRMVPRFNEIERIGHWLLATSFILLAITGAALMFGRAALIPLIGKEGFATVATLGKWVHNNVGWAFILGLVLVFVLWVAQNIPNRHDMKWLAMGGGFFGGGHPPSKKFNAGQKLVFWSVIVLGGSIAVSGLSLLFPFELPVFAATFAKLNALGALIGSDLGLPAALTPHQEMQFAQLWHSIVSFALIAIIIAHIYIGSVGMEGGFEAMGSGEVDVNWAREHHDLWVAELERKGRVPGAGAATPAE